MSRAYHKTPRLDFFKRTETEVERLRRKLRAVRDAGVCPPEALCQHPAGCSPMKDMRRYDDTCRRCWRNWARRKGE